MKKRGCLPSSVPNTGAGRQRLERFGQQREQRDAEQRADRVADQPRHERSADVDGKK